MLCALSAALPSVMRLFLPEFRTLSTVPFPVFHNPDTVSQPDKPLSRQDVSNDFSVVFPFLWSLIELAPINNDKSAGQLLYKLYKFSSRMNTSVSSAITQMLVLLLRASEPPSAS